MKSNAKKKIKVIEKYKLVEKKENKGAELASEISFRHFSSLIEKVMKDAYKEVIGTELPENGIFHLDIKWNIDYRNKYL